MKTRGSYQKSLFVALAAALATVMMLPLEAHAEYVVFKNGSRLQISFHLMESGNKAKLILTSEGYAIVDAGTIEKFEQEDYLPPPPQEKNNSLPALPLPSFSAPYHKLIQEASRKTGLHEMLIATVIEAESNFDRFAVSPKGARGLMQLTPDTAQRLGVHSIYDARENIFAGAKYLRELLKEFQNDLYLALAAYNAGPEKVVSYNGIPPFRETQDYVAKVAARFARRREKTHLN